MFILTDKKERTIEKLKASKARLESEVDELEKKMEKITAARSLVRMDQWGFYEIRFKDVKKLRHYISKNSLLKILSLFHLLFRSHVFKSDSVHLQLELLSECPLRFCCSCQEFDFFFV